MKNRAKEFDEWMLKIGNTYYADVERMSKAFELITPNINPNTFKTYEKSEVS